MTENDRYGKNQRRRSGSRDDRQYKNRDNYRKDNDPNKKYEGRNNRDDDNKRRNSRENPGIKRHKRDYSRQGSREKPSLSFEMYEKPKNIDYKSYAEHRAQINKRNDSREQNPRNLRNMNEKNRHRGSRSDSRNKDDASKNRFVSKRKSD